MCAVQQLDHIMNAHCSLIHLLCKQFVCKQFVDKPGLRNKETEKRKEKQAQRI